MKLALMKGGDNDEGDERMMNVKSQASNRHYGRKKKKHRQNSNLINHFPTSEGVSELSERANE